MPRAAGSRPSGGVCGSCLCFDRIAAGFELGGYDYLRMKLTVGIPQRFSQRVSVQDAFQGERDCRVLAQPGSVDFYAVARLDLGTAQRKRRFMTSGG